MYCEDTGYLLHSRDYPSLPHPCVTLCHDISTGLNISICYFTNSHLYRNNFSLKLVLYIIHSSPTDKKRSNRGYILYDTIIIDHIDSNVLIMNILIFIFMYFYCYIYIYICFVLYILFSSCQLELFGYPDTVFSVLFPQL